MGVEVGRSGIFFKFRVGVESVRKPERSPESESYFFPVLEIKSNRFKVRSRNWELEGSRYDSQSRKSESSVGLEYDQESESQSGVGVK